MPPRPEAASQSQQAAEPPSKPEAAPQPQPEAVSSPQPVPVPSSQSQPADAASPQPAAASQPQAETPAAPQPGDLDELSVPDEAAGSPGLDLVLPDSPPDAESFSVEAYECESGPNQKGYSDAGKMFKAAVNEFKCHRFKEAADDAFEVMSLFPDKPWEGRAAFLAARAMGELKDYDACGSLFELAMDRMPLLGEYSLYLLAGYYYEGGMKKEAEETYKKFISLHPGSILVKEALLNCAESMVDLQQYPDAVKMLKSLIVSKPGPDIAPKARLLFIRACIETGELKTASYQFRILRLEYPWAVETTRAEELIRKAGITPPEMKASELMHIGDLMAGKGLSSQAEEVYMEALGKSDDPASQSKALLRLGKVYYRMRENRQAESVLLGAMSLASQEEAADIYLALARLYLRLGDKDKFRDAALWCESLVPGEPRGADALYLLGAKFSQDGDYDSAAAIFNWILAEYPDSNRTDEILWQEGWACLRKGNYVCANAAFDGLVSRFPESTLAPQALYWKTKALEALGLPDKASQTSDELRRSYGWSFYGLLSGEPGARDIEPRPEVAPEPATIEVPIKDSYRDKRLARAYELGLQGMRTSAARELKKAEKAYSHDLDKLKEIIGLYVFAGEVRRPFDMASNLYSASLNTGSTKLSEEALRLLFPLGYWDSVMRGASKAGVDPLLISGVIRQESRFNEGAVSPAGAIGLMQLMPGTAKMVCRKLSIKFKRPHQLLDSRFNIPVGAFYLQSLIQKHKGRLVYALAEYNAGPENLARWTRKMPDAPDDVFIEGIDFKETRGYVKKVLRNYMAYKKLYIRKKPESAPASAEAKTSSPLPQ